MNFALCLAVPTVIFVRTSRETMVYIRVAIIDPLPDVDAESVSSEPETRLRTKTLFIRFIGSAFSRFMPSFHTSPLSPALQRI